MPNDQHMDYLIYNYFCYDQNPTTPDCSIIGDGDGNCLSPTELSFYTQSYFDLIKLIGAQNFPGHTPLGVIVAGDLEQGPWAAYHHNLVITYGIVEPVQ